MVVLAQGSVQGLKPNDVPFRNAHGKKPVPTKTNLVLFFLRLAVTQAWKFIGMVYPVVVFLDRG